MTKLLEKKYVLSDIRHYISNISLTFIALIFYYKFGFYGWHHFISLVFIQYAALALDDWIEKKRPFPYYCLLLLGVGFYFYPILTVITMTGLWLTNLRYLLKREDFILERLEGFGNLPYALILLQPIGLTDLKTLVSVSLFILFVDSFHKIGHRDTKYPNLMWISAFAIMFLDIILWWGNINANLFDLSIFLVLAVLSVVPFRLFQNKPTAYGWAYYQYWQAMVAFFGFYNVAFSWVGIYEKFTAFGVYVALFYIMFYTKKFNYIKSVYEKHVL